MYLILYIYIVPTTIPSQSRRAVTTILFLHQHQQQHISYDSIRREQVLDCAFHFLFPLTWHLCNSINMIIVHIQYTYIDFPFHF